MITLIDNDHAIRLITQVDNDAQADNDHENVTEKKFICVYLSGVCV